MKKSVLYLLYYITLIFIITQVVSALNEECPSPEENYPCYCEEEDGSTDMHCNNFNDNKQIVQGLSSLKNHKIFKVTLLKSKISLIKSDAFKGPEISQILFFRSESSLEAPQFVGQESSLKRVTFLSCFKNNVLEGSFDLSHLENLKDVTFDSSTIAKLDNNWLTSPAPNLRSLTFSECGIKELGNKAFQKVTELSSIFLNDNEITSISRSMFPRPAENLRTINLSNNKLQDLPDDIFEDMPSLNSLELEKNLLKTLSESTWGSVIENFSRVYLEGNEFRCDKSMKWISKVRLPKLLTGTCHLPAKLKNKNLRLLTPADFH